MNGMQNQETLFLFLYNTTRKTRYGTVVNSAYPHYENVFTILADRVRGKRKTSKNSSSLIYKKNAISLKFGKEENLTCFELRCFPQTAPFLLERSLSIASKVLKSKKEKLHLVVLDVFGDEALKRHLPICRKKYQFFTDKGLNEISFDTIFVTDGCDLSMKNLKEANCLINSKYLLVVDIDISIVFVKLLEVENFGSVLTLRYNTYTLKDILSYFCLKYEKKARYYLDRLDNLDLDIKSEVGDFFFLTCQRLINLILTNFPVSERHLFHILFRGEICCTYSEKIETSIQYLINRNQLFGITVSFEQEDEVIKRFFKNQQEQ